MSMVSMKMSQAERDEMSISGSSSDVVYPYGLRIDLDDEALAKLGLLDNLPDVGEVIVFTARATVVSVSQNAAGEAGDPTDKEQHVAMQITDMDVPTAPASAPHASLYGGG